MNILKSLGIISQRESIVQRLLDNGQISAAEAIVLLKVKETINIRVAEISSGARVIAGDDNSVEQR